MWHWLHKNVSVIDPVVRTSIIFSVTLHLLCILLFWLLHYLQPTRQLTIQRNMPLSTAITIIIDPRALVTGVVMHTQRDGNVQELNKSAVIKTESKKSTTTIVTKPSAAKQSKKQVKKKTVSQKSKKSANTQKKIVKQKPMPRKAAPEKQVIEQAKPQLTPPEAVKLPVGSELPVSIDGPIMIARSASDVAALAMQLEIQEELLRVWRPPVGIDEGVSCTIKLTLDANGAAQMLEIVKPSGILLFDVSARAAVQQASWPRAFWGTTLELCLQ